MINRLAECRAYALVGLAVLGLLSAPQTAAAQYRSAGPTPGVGEGYHIEASYGWWDADPSLFVNSESLGIDGSDIDLVDDLGIEQHRLGKLDIVLKPGKKHRFKYQHMPIKYETDAFPVTREFIFNGQLYRIGLPVTTSVDFSTDSFGYEYDFLYFPRGFLGAGISTKLTKIHVDLQSPIGAEFFKQAAPIPAIGFAGRLYVTPKTAIDAEISFFRVPDSVSELIEGDGSYNDFDIHTTYNVNRYFGTQLGWKQTTIFYTTDSNTGDLKFNGLYFGAVLRY